MMVEKYRALGGEVREDIGLPIYTVGILLVKGLDLDLMPWFKPTH